MKVACLILVVVVCFPALAGVGRDGKTLELPASSTDSPPVSAAPDVTPLVDSDIPSSSTGTSVTPSGYVPVAGAVGSVSSSPVSSAPKPVPVSVSVPPRSPGACAGLPRESGMYGISADGDLQDLFLALGPLTLYCRVPDQTGVMTIDCSVHAPVICESGTTLEMVDGPRRYRYPLRGGYAIDGMGRSVPNGTYLTKSANGYALMNLPPTQSFVFSRVAKAVVLDRIDSYLPNGATAQTPVRLIYASDGQPRGYSSTNGSILLTLGSKEIRGAGTDADGNALNFRLTEENGGYRLLDVEASRTLLYQQNVHGSRISGDLSTGMGFSVVGTRGSFQVGGATLIGSAFAAAVDPDQLFVDAGGGAISVTDPKIGVTSRVVFDSFGRAVSQTDPSGSITFQYGVTGLLARVGLSEGSYRRTVTYQYGTMGQASGFLETDPLGTTSTTCSDFDSFGIPGACVGQVNGVEVARSTIKSAVTNGVGYVTSIVIKDALTSVVQTTKIAGNSITVTDTLNGKGQTTFDKEGLVTLDKATRGPLTIMSQVTSSFGLIPKAVSQFVTLGTTLQSSASLSRGPASWSASQTNALRERVSVSGDANGVSINASGMNGSVQASSRRYVQGDPFRSQSRASGVAGGVPFSRQSDCQGDFSDSRCDVRGNTGDDRYTGFNQASH